MKISPVILSIVFACSVFSNDIMVERMQSVVDEVSELRLRYENSVRENIRCMDQLQKQNEVIKKISADEGLDYKVFEENRKQLGLLEEENKRLRENTGTDQALQEMQKELKALEKENQRLAASAEMLKEKNKSLLAQINTVKKTQSNEDVDTTTLLKAKVADLEAQIKSYKNSSAQEKNMISAKEYLRLETEKRDLEKAFQKCTAKECKPVKKAVISKVCADDNPFPKLMMKDEEEIQPSIKSETPVTPHKMEEEPVIDLSPVQEDENTTRSTLEKAGTYRVKYESSVYDAPGGKVIEVWEEKTSFTSNISEGDWIKITGYFIDRKWHKNTAEMWVKEEHTLKR